MTPADRARREAVSAIHDRLAAAGAYFRDVSGWEGADWYRAAAARRPKVEKLSWGRQNWFPWWAAEHRAAREGVILMDMSFMSKFLVQGRDAGRVLNHISANNVDGEAGRITYTQWLNDARQARGRPDRHQARRRALPGRRHRHHAPPRRNLAAAPYPR